MINPLLSEKVQEDCLEVFITALGEASKNLSIGFIRQGTNFIKTDHCSMQLLGNNINFLALDPDESFALKYLQEVLEGIDDVARHEESLI